MIGQPGFGLFATLMTGASLPGAAASDGIVRPRESLWPGAAPLGDGTKDTAQAYITVYSPDKPNGTAVVICPGGGYGGLVTEGEGSGIAKWLNSHNITGIVLEYRLPHGRYHRPLLDVQRAMRTVRARAKELGCRSDRIGIIGFSAGGHLASTAATHFDNGKPDATDPIEKESCRPDFAILVYPVISFGSKGHPGSGCNFLGENPSAAELELFSNEKQVTAQTPPSFLAHAMDDTVVPPVNSEMFYDALVRCGVPAKYLELESGGHGLNGYKGPMWDKWQAQSIEWLRVLEP